MFEGQSGSYAESDSGRSSRESTWRERRQKRHEDREHKREEEQFGLVKGLYQTHWTISGAFECRRFDERYEELERLHRLVRDLELEARGRCRRRNREEREEGSVSVGGRYETESH